MPDNAQAICLFNMQLQTAAKSSLIKYQSATANKTLRDQQSTTPKKHKKQQVRIEAPANNVKYQSQTKKRTWSEKFKVIGGGVWMWLCQISQASSAG